MTEINGETSDGYHTFNELYEYRLLLTANLFNEWTNYNPTRFSFNVCKSKLHSDGTIPFNDPNWFIVVAETSQGQISFHYEIKDWDLFNIPEVVMPPKYDGHTPKEAAERLRKLLVNNV